MIKKILLAVSIIVIAAIIYFAFNFLNIANILKRQKDIPFVQELPRQQEDKQKEDIPQLSTVAQNLEVPWALAFLPNKGIIFTERPGRVRLIDGNGNLQEQPVANINIKQIGEGGLLGIELHPDFEKNNFVYIYYTYAGDNDNTLNRVSRFKYGGKSLSGEKTIVDKIPGAVFHNGGRIKFGPDKLLYVTAGDSLNPSLAQDTNSLAGKILRVTDEGKTVGDNPFANPVYSYGHRNPQGIAWDNQGRLWETEHGESHLDEFNLIEKGKNYGWPTIRGDQTNPNMVSPTVHSGSATWAPSGAAYLNGSVYFAGLRGQTLFEAKINGNSAQLIKHLEGQLGRIREVVVGPDNMLYITTSNRDGRGVPTAGDDKIIRVNPAKL